MCEAFTPYGNKETALEYINTRLEFFKKELETHKAIKVVLGFTDRLTRYDDKQTAYNIESIEELSKVDLSIAKKIIYPNGKSKAVKVLPPCISSENEYQTPELFYGLY